MRSPSWLAYDFRLGPAQNSELGQPQAPSQRRGLHDSEGSCIWWGRWSHVNCVVAAAEALLQDEEPNALPAGLPVPPQGSSQQPARPGVRAPGVGGAFLETAWLPSFSCYSLLLSPSPLLLAHHSSCLLLISISVFPGDRPARGRKEG